MKAVSTRYFTTDEQQFDTWSQAVMHENHLRDVWLLDNPVLKEVLDASDDRETRMRAMEFINEAYNIYIAKDQRVG